MKAMKKLIPSLCLLLITAVLMGTSTYAWFSMNTAVTATGMSVTAQAESGIVISNSEKAAWNASASSSTGSLSLYPTSTSAGAKWYHSSSTDASLPHAGNQPYVEVTNSGSTNYYSESVFYIKSATTSALTKNLNIKKVTITPPNTITSANLDKSLRVLVKVGDFTAIYAPDGATFTYTVAGTTSVTAKAVSSVENVTVEGIATIPANSSTPIEVHIFVYYEGEDANCISNNVAATIDTMNVSVQFEAVDPPTPSEP